MAEVGKIKLDIVQLKESNESKQEELELLKRHMSPAFKEIEKIKEYFLLLKSMYEKILQEKSDMESYHSQNASDSEEEYEMPIQETIHCNHCRFKCLDNLILEIHMDKEHIIRCPNCKFTFGDDEKLKKHMSV